MGVIETEEAAKRLARVIVSDIEIYNREKFQAGADLTAAIEEGRALFRSRVAPELHPLFSTVLEDRRATRKKADAAKAADAALPNHAGGATETKPSPEAAPAPAAPAAQPAAAPAPARVVGPVAPPPVIVAEPTLPVAVAPATAPVAVAPATAPEALAPAASSAPVEPAPAPAAPPTERPAPAAAQSPARAGIIDTEEAAARLARVILSDIELYNAKKVASGADLTYEINEGRALFKTRVSVERLGIFETVLATKGLGQRKRVASPVPVPKAKPAAPPPPAAVAEPAPMAVAAPPRASAPPAAGRPGVSAVHAPPTSQPRPGVTAPQRRPTPAPLSGPAALTDSGSERHFVPAAAHAAPASRPGIAAPPPPSDDLTPIPGRSDDLTPAPGLAPVPAPRPTASRPPPTPPPVPLRPATSPTPMRAVTGSHAAVTPRHERRPSASELPILTDSLPPHQPPTSQPRELHSGIARANMPSQEVLDALPVATPLPALPSTSQAPPAAELHALAAVIPHIPTPASLSQPQVALPTQFSAESSIDDEVVSLRGGMSKARMLATIAAVGASGAVIWYFFLR